VTLATKLYVGSIISAGVIAVAPEIPHFHFEHPIKFLVYGALAVLASRMKVKLPGIEGNMSVLFVLLLIGIVELTVAETLLIGAVCVLTQSFLHSQRRPRLIQLVFNLASLMLAIRLTAAAYSFPALQRLNAPLPVCLGIAAVIFFLANTFPVAVVIALSEGKSLRQTWQGCYFWSFPYYLAGAAITGLATLMIQHGGWPTVVLFAPLLYAMYWSYGLYLDRLKAETALAREMTAAAARVTSVLESTSDCVFAVDHESRITYLNQRARSRFSAGKELKGMNLREALPEFSGGGFFEHYEKALAAKESQSYEEFFPKLKAWFEVHFYRSPEGLAIYLHEVTEKRVLQEELRQSQKMEALGRLAGGVAHDFNNLLTIILGYGQQLAEMLPPGDTLQERIAEIRKAGERASALTQQLLAFSRKQPVKPQVLQLNAVVQGTEKMLKRLIGEDIVLSVVLEPNLAPIKADRGQIEQIIMNLAVNSRDAMPEGGQLTLTTEDMTVIAGDAFLKPGRYAVLSMTDTGQGMDADTKARAFEPFFSTKEQGKGTGLGLSTVYGIVEQWHGRISVESQPGAGARFTIHLPCFVEAEEDRVKELTRSKRHSAGRPILLVEDDEGVRKLTVSVLSGAGYRVLALESGREVFNLPTESLASTDLLITDVILRGISGVEVATRLKAEHPNLRVLYISGYSDHPLLARGVLPGGTDLLQKPYTPDQLLKAVEAVLEHANDIQSS
jgi:signal transduction histidine kinase/CheY-like chemotaxis protein